MTDWNRLESHCKITCPYGGWKPAAIRAEVDRILSKSPESAVRTKLGVSHEGRPIELLQLGTGKHRVLMWTQMHGNEPTHTTVLMNLLDRLVNHPSEGLSENLLGNLTIGMVLGLNPDGSERNIRHNAQGIDINRDALQFSTPEGRIFRDLIQSYQPKFGFNLHNQRHRLSIGEPAEPVAVSLLVPPIDEEDSQNESTRLATQVAATFCEKVRRQCGNRISRYGIEYMARAFGEWVQRQGVSVILVEAGGWPDGQFDQLEKLHYAALAQTLEAIALDKLDDAAAESYHELPKFHDHLMFDLLVDKSKIAQSPDGTMTEAEIGINYPSRLAGVPCNEFGVIEAVGDLHENGGIDTLASNNNVVVPGRIVIGDSAEQALAVGATTLLTPIQFPNDLNQLSQAIEKLEPESMALNRGLVTYGDWLPSDFEPCFQILAAASVKGLVAVLLRGDNPTVSDVCNELGIPAIQMKEIPESTAAMPVEFGDWVKETHSVAKLLGWQDRGRIDLSLPADFALVRASDTADCDLSLQQVVVGGSVAWQSGAIVRLDVGVRLV